MAATGVVPALGREAEAWELASFAAGAFAADSPVRVVLGGRGSGRSTLLSAVSGADHVRSARVSGPRDMRDVDLSDLDALLIDDVDRLAPDDLDALLFAGRRLPGSVRLIATGDVSLLPVLAHAGVGVVLLDPLSGASAARLLDARAERPLADHVRARILSDACGNPRALIDLLAGLDASQRSGAGRLPDPLPLRPSAAAFWLAGGPSGRDLTALAALAMMGEARLAWIEAAADLLGVEAPVAGWERAGLIVIDAGTARCATPILRAAAVAGLSAADRSRVLDAAASALPDEEAHDRSVWLRALAATRDDELADALDATAARVRRRYGAGAAADVIERAAELTHDRRAASPRRVRAAHAAWQAGWPTRAQALLRGARPLPDDPDVHALAALVEGALALGAGDPRAATEELLRGARAAAIIDPPLALDQLARAAGAAIWDSDAPLIDAIALALPRDAARSAFGLLVATTVTASARMIRGDHSVAGRLREALAATSPALRSPRQLIFAAETAGLLGDDDGSLLLLHRASRAAEGPAARSDAAFALELLAHVNVWQGRLDAAVAAAEGGLELARRLDERDDGAFQLGMLAHVAALRGEDEAALAHAERATAAAGGREPATVSWALGRAALSRGDFDGAAARLQQMTRTERRNTLVALFAAPDVVEAAAEAGTWEGVDALADDFAAWAAAGSPWAQAVMPRIRAMRLGGDAGTDLLLAALGAPQTTPRPFDDARTRLVLGRGLRRARRRGEAREHLRLAATTFEHLGLVEWVARANAELRASGEAAALQGAVELEVLTAQEQEIATMIGEGLSNRAAAERLHLSPRTIEYHLSKVYVKLGISHRSQLTRLIAASQ